MTSDSFCDVSSASNASSASAEISSGEFRHTLRRLCTGDARNFPRGGRNRAVLLKAASLYLRPAHHYTEQELTDRLRQWLSDVGTTLRTDPVTLRRALVDHGYLDRDPPGRIYRVLERSQWKFAATITNTDQRAALAP